jgi:hypothetical protein
MFYREPDFVKANGGLLAFFQEESLRNETVS